jgi:hypothetical protein
MISIYPPYENANFNIPQKNQQEASD